MTLKVVTEAAKAGLQREIIKKDPKASALHAAVERIQDYIGRVNEKIRECNQRLSQNFADQDLKQSIGKLEGRVTVLTSELQEQKHALVARINELVKDAQVTQLIHDEYVLV